MIVRADRACFAGEQVLGECERTGVLPCVPKIDTSGKARLSLFELRNIGRDAVAGRMWSCSLVM